MKIEKILLTMAAVLMLNCADAQYFKVFGGKIQQKISPQASTVKNYVVTGIAWLDGLMPFNCNIRVTSDAGDDFIITDVNNIIVTPETENTFHLEIVLPDGAHIHYADQTMENDE